MKTTHSRHSSLYLQESSQSVYNSDASPILKTGSGTPLKQRKSVHFADSVFEVHQGINDQLSAVYNQLKVSCTKRKPHQSQSPQKPQRSQKPQNPQKPQKPQKSQQSQPPPCDYIIQPNTPSTPKKTIPYSTDVLLKSLELRRINNAKRINNQTPGKVKRPSSVARSLPINLQPELNTKKMNFAFRDSSFYSKLNQFYKGKTGPEANPNKRK